MKRKWLLIPVVGGLALATGVLLKRAEAVPPEEIPEPIKPQPSPPPTTQAIIMHGKNIPATAQIWQLVMGIETPYGQNILVSFIGSPAEMTCDPQSLPDPTWSIPGNVFTNFSASYTWAAWPPPGGEMASSFWGPVGSAGPITLIGQLIPGAHYDFDFLTGEVIQR